MGRRPVWLAPEPSLLIDAARKGYRVSAGNLEHVIALIGDLRGDRAWANARLQSVGERGIRLAVQAGDLGLWPGPSGKQCLRTVDAVCEKVDLELRVVPGNHDDWGRLTTMWENPKRRDDAGAPLPLYLTDRIAVLPRGWRWTMGGRTLVALGGAPSVDFIHRSRGKTWWAEEQMTHEDVDRTVAGGHAQVMVTHDAPGPPWCVPKVAQIIRNNPMGWPDRALACARVGRDLVTEAFLGVRPRLLIHGHYHVSGERTVRLPGADFETRIWSLDMNGKAGNVRLLDLDTFDSPQPAPVFTPILEHDCFAPFRPRPRPRRSVRRGWRSLDMRRAPCRRAPGEHCARARRIACATR